MLREVRFGKIVFIPGPGEGRYPFCNSLLIDDKVRAVIDPGSDEGWLRRLQEKGPVRAVIQSHYHEDHGSFGYLFPTAELCVHKSEASCYRDIDKVLEFYGLRGTEYEDVWRNILLQRFNYRARKPTCEFQDGDLMQFGETTLRVIHTPGHSIGHSCFYFPDEGVLYLGDLDMTKFGPWYGDRVSDIDSTIESVRKLMTVPARFFVSAHETGVIEGDLRELAEEYIAVIEEREKKLLAFLDRPRTLDEIVGQWIVYKRPREPRHFFEFGERALMKKHIERLEKRGLLRQQRMRYSLV